MEILVTGAAGFIGFHTSKRLLEDGHKVIGLDNVNDYYDVNLKRDRLKILRGHDQFRFYEINLEDQGAVDQLFKKKLRNGLSIWPHKLESATPSSIRKFIFKVIL